MNKQQSGFTLIELIMVIVILGILAAVAVPRFIDLQTDAREAAAQGVAGAFAGGGAINYAACAVGNTTCVPIAAGDDCDGLGNLIQGGFPDGFDIDGTVPECTVTHEDGGATAKANILATDAL